VIFAVQAEHVALDELVNDQDLLALYGLEDLFSFLVVDQL